MEQLPLYQCHKKVRAAKIAAVDEDRLILEGLFGVVRVGTDYRARHRPLAGGYYVIYADSYESYSPAEAFESGYSLIDESTASTCQSQSR